MSSQNSKIKDRLGVIGVHCGATSLVSFAKYFGINYKTFQKFSTDGELGHAISSGFLENGYSVDWIMTGMGWMLAPSVEPEPMQWGCANLTTDEAQLVLHHRNASDNQKKYILEYSGIRSRNSEEFDKLGKGPNQTIHRLEAQAKLKKSERP